MVFGLMMCAFLSARIFGTSDTGTCQIMSSLPLVNAVTIDVGSGWRMKPISLKHGFGPNQFGFGTSDRVWLGT